MTDFIARSRKAIVAAAVAGAGTYTAAAGDGVSAAEWGAVAASVAAAFVVTWLTGNKTDPSAPPTP